MKKIKRNNEAKYVDEHKHEKFVSNKHFIHDIEIHNPLSLQYQRYWKDLKRRCIEGYWYEGKWMPGNLYFYVNFWKIRLNKDNNSKSKIVARPFLRDLEWEKAYVFAEAKGFSGFKDDTEYTCHRLVEYLNKNPEQKSLYNIPEDCFKPNGEFKKYKDARKYLREIKSKNLGKPLYHNAAQNVIDIESRGGGKSFWAAGGLVAHNFLMDGAIDYDELFAGLSNGNRMSSETLVGAIDGAYSRDLLNKVQLGFDELVGEQMFQGETYPSPFKKEYNGSWFSGKQFIEAKVDKFVGGKWKRVGSGSIVHHRSFNDDPFAGNGTRPSLSVLEEVGFFHNLKESLGAMKDTTYNGPNKFGIIYMMGTGGNMQGGSSEAAMEVFNNPKEFDCLCFEDEWEDSGDIGFFIPYEKTLNEYKDEEGNTQWDRAIHYVDIKREALRKGKSKKPLYDEMQNNPRLPSEAFLVLNANIFPVGELKEQLGWVQSNQHDAFVKGECGKLLWETVDGQLKIKWKPDLHEELKPCHYKMKRGEDTTGCIQIWEHPQYTNGQIPYGLYISGCLPPGEKVMTDKGLLKIEEVTETEKLYSIDGNQTNIEAFTRYEVQEEDLYKLKVSNTYRTTTFTKEHPIYASLPIVKYRGLKKRGEGFKQAYKTFNFDFIKAEDLTLNHWVKVPNIYREEKEIDLNLWKNDSRCDRNVENPLTQEDFWWFVGLFLGDGWTESNGHNIYIVFDIKNKQSLEKFRRIIKTLFNRSFYERVRKNSVEVSFSCLELKNFLDENFGKGAVGKCVPEWVKRLHANFKMQLVSGYINSDGCVTKSGKYYTTEFVSINLELLESFQDILFSIGIVSNLTLLRKEGKSIIANKEINQQEAYHLRLSTYDTKVLCKHIIDNEKLNIIPQQYLDSVNLKRYNRNCYLEEDLSFIYFKITNIERSKYTGTVYSFKTKDDTFMCHHIPTHNTDPYDQDNADSSTSLGSTFIYKTFMTSDGIYDWVVAEYTARPGTANEHHENVRKLLTYYNALDLYENERNTLKMHFEHHHSLHLLAKTPTILKATEGSKVQRQYGIHMTEHIKDELEIYLRDWLCEERTDGRLNLHMIYSPALLQELIYYNRKTNSDRGIALMLVICHKLQNFHLKVEDIKQEAFVNDPFLQRAFKGQFFR
jgi:hypothetical protein